MAAIEDECVFCETLTAAFDALSYSGRTLIMKRLLEHSPVSVAEVAALIAREGQKPKKRRAIADLTAMERAGLAKRLPDGTWRAANSCVSNAVRRALTPKRTVFVLTRGRAYDLIGAYATRGGADAAKEDVDRMEDDRVQEIRRGHPDFKPMQPDTEIEEVDVGN